MRPTALVRPVAAASLLGARIAPASITHGCRFFISAKSGARLVAPPQKRPIATPTAPTTQKRHYSADRDFTSSPDKWSLEQQDDELSLKFTNKKNLDGSEKSKLELPLLWLRDVCLCPRCVDPDSGQKNFSTTDLPDAPKAQTAELAKDGSLKVVWEKEILDGDQDGPHVSVWPAEVVHGWVRNEGLAPREQRLQRHLPPSRTLWDRALYESMLEAGQCRVAYQDWMVGGPDFWEALHALARTGMIFVTGVPEGDENEVERIAGQIGILQHTFYGFTWDVKSKPHAENVAYTSKFLGLHQDLMYNEPVPRLQLLHCIQNSSDGGESLFSDGVRAAYELRETDKKLSQMLETKTTLFHYHKGPHNYSMLKSVIQSEAPLLIGKTHWSPPFQGPLLRKSLPVGTTELSMPGVADWKRAATAFQKILESPDNMVEAKLRPGECMIFDNWRVHHGRRAFATGQGSRWLKGCYISPQVYGAMERRLLERKGVLLPDASRWRHRVGNFEAKQVRDLRRQRQRSEEQQTSAQARVTDPYYGLKVPANAFIPREHLVQN